MELLGVSGGSGLLDGDGLLDSGGLFDSGGLLDGSGLLDHRLGSLDSGLDLQTNDHRTQDVLVDVYSLQGVRLRMAQPVRLALQGLDRGMYLVGGKKVIGGDQ